MYLVKSIDSLPLSSELKIDNGITIIERIKNSKNWRVPYSFWGATKIQVGDSADISQFGEGETHFLSYINEFFVKDLEDEEGDKEFTFHVNTYEPEKIEGYIVFINFAIAVNTNGQKLLDREHQIVVLLREKDFLEFNGRKIEVINNHLIMHI